jgi:hypothetical protein
MNRELVSKETRLDVREHLVTWLLPRIESVFRAADVPFTADYHPPVIGTRRVMVERFYRSLDFTKPADAAKFALVCDEVVRVLDHRLQTEPGSADQYRAARDQILHALRRDGFVYEDGRFAVPADEPALAEFHPDTLARTVARIERRIDADPGAAVGAAKTMVETCCAAILAARGKPVTDGRGKKFTALVRRVAAELDLLPAGVVSALMDSLARVFQSANEAARTGRATADLTPGHAKLAVGAAATLTSFLFEAYQARTAA